ncbi:MAG: RelA/SpoT domain-containing protein [Bacillota bacterium]|nr:RelA/SpoT domain-containing protein [Bacillota bacterium]
MITKLDKFDDNKYDEIIEHYKSEDNRNKLTYFRNQVKQFFEDEPTLKKEKVIHSIKDRLKDPDHLREKLIRKYKEEVISKDTLFDKVHDLNGIRILHLHYGQFSTIHDAIMNKVHQEQDWKFVEQPKAYTWDPEIKEFFSNKGLEINFKESFYTSVHYVVTPNNTVNNVKCEIQVRTLFEEIWGEIDHEINYPNKTNIIACREQLKVLARLVSTGSRLVDSIYKSNSADEDIN